ncbi:thiamine ABC transporter substrate-binding protein [Halobacterium wangiae]|uniref:thiamine ABC transporter substrate-binding protein n=1 Tax=Halobacterium wangiae TaxID=2902623 RepID=UPI001E569BE8|nr:thiamine ABC transporter substrate-binding protein [Halobacterium wangiae]
MTSRRRFLASAGTAAALGLAGCLDVASPGGDPDTLKVGTTQSYVDAVSTSAGDWVKAEFEARYDATLEWVVRENELNDFLERRKQGVDLGADVYVGVTPTDLVRADRELDESLFAAFDTDRVPNSRDVVDAYRFDPQDRVLPTGSSYVCIVYDENEVAEPETLEDLTREPWADSLLLPDPQNTVTGLSFLLWTVEAYGTDGYLDYWERLLDNGLRTTGNWNAAYSAYSNEEAPMVVSYSTDQVYAARSDVDMSRHQIAFPNGQGYAYVSGTARFADAGKDDLVHEFANFMLDARTQREVAVKNVGIPTVSDASLPEDVQQYAHVPGETLQYDYDTLRENLGDWRETVSRRIAGQ